MKNNSSGIHPCRPAECGSWVCLQEKDVREYPPKCHCVWYQPNASHSQSILVSSGWVQQGILVNAQTARFCIRIHAIVKHASKPLDGIAENFLRQQSVKQLVKQSSSHPSEKGVFAWLWEWGSPYFNEDRWPNCLLDKEGVLWDSKWKIKSVWTPFK